ncbi:hypothetical protein N7522_006223 [Penicillium canescens]|nr:hypothetical protein N7522_006223 [Penicillium canescens]
MSETVMPEATVEDLQHLSVILEKALPDLINHELPNSPTIHDQSPTWADSCSCWSVHQLNFPWQLNLLDLVLKAMNKRAFLDQMDHIICREYNMEHFKWFDFVGAVARGSAKT